LDSSVSSLKSLYGDYDALISAWEALLDESVRIPGQAEQHSGASRTGFRAEAEQHSGVKPNRIPG